MVVWPHVRFIMKFLIIRIVCVESSANEGSNKLLNDIRPYLEAHKALIPLGKEIYYGLSLLHVVHLNEAEQIVKVHLRVTMAWKDQFFSWNPDDYNGAKRLLLSLEEPWQPDIVVFNCVQEEYQTQIKEAFIEILHTGDVYYTYPITVETQCLVNVRYFPFDQQTCPLEIGSWSYSMTYLNLNLAAYPNQTDQNLENSAWQFQGFTADRKVIKYACCPDPFTVLYFNIKLARRWSINGAYLILPNFIITLLGIVQFLLPCDTGERAGFGITVFFALLVYLLLVEEVLPPTEEFPIFVSYIFTTLIEASIAEVEAIVVIFIHNKGAHDHHRQVPAWMKKYVLHGISKLLCMQHLIMPEAMTDRIKGQYELHRHYALLDDLGKKIVRIDRNVQTDDALTVDDNRNISFHNNLSQKRNEGVVVKRRHNLNNNKKVTITVKKGQGSTKKMKGAPVRRMTVSQFARTSLTSGSIGKVKKDITIIRHSELEWKRDFLLERILNIMESYEGQAYNEQREQMICQEWQQVVMVLDRFMFYSFLGFNLLLWSYIFYLMVDHHVSMSF